MLDAAHRISTNFFFKREVDSFRHAVAWLHTSLSANTASTNVPRSVAQVLLFKPRTDCGTNFGSTLDIRKRKIDIARSLQEAALTLLRGWKGVALSSQTSMETSGGGGRTWRRAVESSLCGGLVLRSEKRMLLRWTLCTKKGAQFSNVLYQEGAQRSYSRSCWGRYSRSWLGL